MDLFWQSNVYFFDWRIESSLVLLEEGVCYDQCVLLANISETLPCFILTPRQNLTVIPGISWLPTFAFQSPIMKRTSVLGVNLFWVLVLKGPVGIHRTVQLQLLQCYWSGHRLGLLWYWMVCLGNKQRSSYNFWDCIQVFHFRLFCWVWWLLHFFYWIPAHTSRYNCHLS